MQDSVKKERKAVAWRALDPAARTQVKTLVTSLLGTADPGVRRVLALLIAKIGGAEITPETNNWTQLIPGLCSTVQNAAAPEDARTTSLYALSLLLQELDEYEDSPLEQDHVNTILACVVGCMANTMSLPIQRAAVKALTSSLPFVDANFKIAAARDRIMSAVCASAASEDLDVKKAALQ